jgi:hypothetical protein
MADSFNQTGILSINDSSDDLRFITSFGMSFNQGAGKVLVSITANTPYEDKSPLFDFFIQGQPATIKIQFTNSLDSRGPTTRTLEFKNAMCRSYVETYSNSQTQSEGLNDLLVSVQIEADSGNIGETGF